MELIKVIIYISCFVVAFIIGGISPAIIIARTKGIDITKAGSGNAGATNTFRVLGKKLGITVFLLDVLKGFAVTFLIGLIIGENASYFAALGVVLGHIFSVYNKFKGGKGVAAAIGVVFAVNWIMGLICLAVGFLLVFITKKVSIGSIVAAITLVVSSYFLADDFFIYALVIAAVVIYKHKSNIKRLINGEEKSIF